MSKREITSPPKLYRLRERRKARGLSQGELAKLADTSRREIYRLELLQYGARPSTAARLAKALRCKPEELQGKEDHGEAR